MIILGCLDAWAQMMISRTEWNQARFWQEKNIMEKIYLRLCKHGSENKYRYNIAVILQKKKLDVSKLWKIRDIS